MSATQWLRDTIQRVRNRGSGRAGSAITETSVLDHYVTAMPGHQNAIDAVPGWSNAFPPVLGLNAGGAHLYEDGRILWCLDQMGSLAGKSVLELGPLEGMHSYMLAKAGAAHIDAIEANALAYVRCLITKEIMGIPNTSFFLGDFTPWLEQPTKVYDLVVASGVLYHSADPIRLIDLISQNTSCFFIWTHYFDEMAMKPDDLRRVPFSGRVEKRAFRDLTVELHERSYFRAWRDPKFCGGLQDRHFWMTKQDMLRVIDALGFDTATALDVPDHPNGPSFCIFAKRRAPLSSEQI